MTTVRVYINGRGVDAPSAATALDAVRLYDVEEAEGIAANRRGLVDSRGLPVAPNANVFGGAILRIVSARAAEAAGA